jgi:hypothetical protein
MLSLVDVFDNSELKVDFKPLYRCIHIDTALDSLDELRKSYQADRRDAVSCFGRSFSSRLTGSIGADPPNPNTLERANLPHPRGRWVLHRGDSCPQDHGQLPF